MNDTCLIQRRKVKFGTKSSSNIGESRMVEILYNLRSCGV
jgi:hypothetical protein